MHRDYYLILGIASDASQTDIKDAYRRLAKTYHPDHYQGNSRPFQDIQEAYDVLSDPDRRKTHDAQTQHNRPIPRRPIFPVRWNLWFRNPGENRFSARTASV